MSKVRLRSFYEQEVIPYLKKEFNYENIQQIPTLEKIVLNRGISTNTNSSNVIDASQQELTNLTGQRAVITKAKKSIAGFKLRKNSSIGIRVTLRGDRMFAFFDRLINLALPRIRDFQGVRIYSFDGHGNYTLGLHDQLMFPELSYDMVGELRGMDVSIVTTAETNKEAFELLRALGMPFNE